MAVKPFVEGYFYSVGKAFEAEQLYFGQIHCDSSTVRQFDSALGGSQHIVL